MRIREARIEDALAVATVIHTIVEIKAIASQGVEVTRATVETNLARIAAAGTSSAYVVENDLDVVVGYCAVHWVPFLFFPGGEAYITELFIRPTDTGKRLGSTLLEQVVAEARRRGCARLSLLNGRSGAAYKREFYRKLGWVERESMANFILTLPTRSTQS